MTDVRALQVMLDAGVTHPGALLAAMPTGDMESLPEAIRIVSEAALRTPPNTRKEQQHHG